MMYCSFLETKNCATKFGKWCYFWEHFLNNISCGAAQKVFGTMAMWCSGAMVHQYVKTYLGRYSFLNMIKYVICFHF